MCALPLLYLYSFCASSWEETPDILLPSTSGRTYCLPGIFAAHARFALLRPFPHLVPATNRAYASPPSGGSCRLLARRHPHRTMRAHAPLLLPPAGDRWEEHENGLATHSDARLALADACARGGHRHALGRGAASFASRCGRGYHIPFYSPAGGGTAAVTSWACIMLPS